MIIGVQRKFKNVEMFKDGVPVILRFVPFSEAKNNSERNVRIAVLNPNVHA